MATTAVPYLLEDLMLVQAFMVSLHVPQLQGGESVKTVLRELVPMSQVSFFFVTFEVFVLAWTHV